MMANGDTMDHKFSKSKGLHFRKRLLLFFASVILLFFSMLFQWPTALNTTAVKDDFDSASTGMMAGDLLYMQNYGLTSIIVQRLEPLDTLSDGTTIKNAAQIRGFFETGAKIDAADYSPYKSNICIHRYFYRMIDSVLPISNTATLKLIEAIN
ncbi:MAG: hypothetical protein ACK5L3_03600, partial [Oscillospiraceae bacterium]